MNVKKIVIVEDNVSYREALSLVIKKADAYKVVGQYGNCEDALKKLEVDQPDLVLMDIELPTMNGIKGTTEIKKRLPQCLVLMVTFSDDSEKIFLSLCAGADGYIIKGTDVEELMSSIAQALAGGAPMSPSIARKIVKSFHTKQDSPLTLRQTEILQFVAEGKSYSQIAEELFISKETVKSHIKTIYEKLQVSCKSEALKVAVNNKWIVAKHL